jgi:RNA polymerase sigma-70 factor (ECF subfamily)
MHLDRDRTPTTRSHQWQALLNAAKDKAHLAEVFNESRDRLKRIVNASIDRRVQGRIDASDILQETFLEASGRIDEYLAAPNVSLFVWLRFLAKQQLTRMHRRHLQVQARDVRRERPLPAPGENYESAVALAAELAARLTTASAALSRKELKVEIQAALDRLDSKSREVLLLRHFEQLSNTECAEVLQLSPTAACNRYVRALERLKQTLGRLEGSEA